MICDNLDKETLLELAQRYKINEQFFIRNYKKEKKSSGLRLKQLPVNLKQRKKLWNQAFEKEFGPYRMRWKKDVFLLYIRKAMNHQEQPLHGTIIILMEKDTAVSIGLESIRSSRQEACKPLLAAVMAVCLAKYHNKPT